MPILEEIIFPRIPYRSVKAVCTATAVETEEILLFNIKIRYKIKGFKEEREFYLKRYSFCQIHKILNDRNVNAIKKHAKRER